MKALCCISSAITALAAAAAAAAAGAWEHVVWQLQRVCREAV
jgi:hypothetical protein